MWSSTAGAASTLQSPSTTGRSFGVVRQGLALRRRSLYDRLRAIAGYDYTRRPSAALVLTPSVWEERLTTRFCERLNLDDCYVAVESRSALERRDLRLWHKYSWVGSSYRTLKDVSSHGSPGGGSRTESPGRKRAALPRPERMAQAVPAFGVSPAEKQTLDLITDHPMIPREHLAKWLRISEGTGQPDDAQPRRYLGPHRETPKTWKHPLHAVRRGHSLRHPPGPHSAAHDRHGLRRHVGHRINTWARQTKHADGITWFFSKLEAEARADPDSNCCGPSPPPGPTGPTTGAIPLSHPMPWGR